MWRPCSEEGEWDQSRTNSFELPHFHLTHGPGWIHIRSVDAAHLGEWRYGLKASFRTFYERHPDVAAGMDMLHHKLVALDGCRRLLRADTSGVARIDRTRRRKALAMERAATAEFTNLLNEGLRWREGSFLRGNEERVWMHLRARGIPIDGRTVCEQCGMVSPGSARARFCDYCRRHRVRFSTRPVFDGGWHADVRVGGRWMSDERDLVVYYTGRCTNCRAAFEATDPKQRYCRNCGSGAGRVRRVRGSPSRTGRQRYRYEHCEGALDFSLSFRYDEQTVHLTAHDGVIETSDAEVARLLDGNHSVRRVV